MSQTIPVMIEGEKRDVPVGISVAAALSLTANPTTRIAVGGQPRDDAPRWAACDLSELRMDAPADGPEAPPSSLRRPPGAGGD